MRRSGSWTCWSKQVRSSPIDQVRPYREPPSSSEAQQRRLLLTQKRCLKGRAPLRSGQQASSIRVFHSISCFSGVSNNSCIDAVGLPWWALGQLCFRREEGHVYRDRSPVTSHRVLLFGCTQTPLEDNLLRMGPEGNFLCERGLASDSAGAHVLLGPICRISDCEVFSFSYPQEASRMQVSSLVTSNPTG